VVASLQQFCSETLGGFYLDVLKDRLYTTRKDGQPRRAAQTVIWHITQTLLRLMAPVLSFTAEEAWACFDHQTAAKDTIFTEVWHELAKVSDGDALCERWTRLREVRAQVMRALELARTAGQIGSSLQAEITLLAKAETVHFLKSFGDELRFVLLVSYVNVQEDALVDNDAGVRVEVLASNHQKCDRCWHYREDVATHTGHETICRRCVDNLEGAGEQRKTA